MTTTTRTTTTSLDASGWTELEHAAVTSWRWWSRQQLLSAEVRFFPEELPALLTQADRLV